MKDLPFSEQELEAFLHTLCDLAALKTMPHFRTNLDVSNKLAGAFDPVTQADKQAENAIRATIINQYKDHGIIGEEHGSINSGSRYQWIIDPIDGTRAFISGIPVWGTLIGLYVDGIPCAGVMDQPFTEERYLAVGQSAKLLVKKAKPRIIRTSPVDRIDQATLMTTSPHLLTGDDDRAYFEVEKQVQLFRYGCDCYAYCLLASGHVDLVIESGLNIYDIAALLPIMKNAGGIVTNWSGGSAAQGGQIVAAANQKLHQEALDLLQR